MTGLKQIENQRAFEKAFAEAKEEPAYKLLEELHKGAYLTQAPADLQHRVHVYLSTGTLLRKK